MKRFMIFLIAFCMIVGTPLLADIQVEFNVDMRTAENFTWGEEVYLSGDFCNWMEPGSEGDLCLEDNDMDSIYTTRQTLPAGDIEYKYFRGHGWNNGEWQGESNRHADIGDTTLVLNDIWGDTGNVYIDSPGPFGGGSGSREDPWLIYTAEHLDSIRYYYNILEYSGHFKLMAHIDLGVSPWIDGEGWDPIGTSENPFKGYFHGGGFTIRNMGIDRGTTAYNGLFGYNRGWIENLVVESALIIRAEGRSGILAGVNEDIGTLHNCHVSGDLLDEGNVGKMGGLTSWNQGLVDSCSANVTIICGGGYRVGGLVAQNPGGILMHSSSEGDIICSGANEVGGIAGKVWNEARLDGCMSNMRIQGGGYRVGGIAGSLENSILTISCSIYQDHPVEGTHNVGGLAGFAYDSRIMDCYSVTPVHSGQCGGGLIGRSHLSQIETSYSTGEIIACKNNEGGLIGYKYGGTVTDCFWDTESSRIRHSAAGTGRPTSDMVRSSNYSNWTLGGSSAWTIWEGHYPFFTGQHTQIWNLPVERDRNYHLHLSVDMRDYPSWDPSVSDVYVSGSFNGWQEPGSNPDYKMSVYDENSSCRFIDLDLPPGNYEYKYFIGSSWEHGEWNGHPNREVTLDDFTVSPDVWAVLPDTIGNDIVFVNSVVSFSSQLTDTSFFSGAWHAEQVLGPPDSYPYYDNKNGLVWLSETPDASREFLELGLPETGYAYGVFVYETYQPGSIDSVSVRNAETGEWTGVWSGQADYAGPYSRIFPILFDKTTYEVDAVRIEYNSQTISSSWNETDAVAVALSDTPGEGNDWYIGMNASWKGYRDDENWLGESIDATDEFDEETDYPEAPAPPGDGVSLYFPHPEWANPLGNHFTNDIRSLQPENVSRSWDFEVMTSDTGLANIDFAMFNCPDLPVMLDDHTLGICQLLTDSCSYEFYSLAGTPREFTITVGDTVDPELVLGDSFSGPAILVSGTTQTLTWNITGSFDLQSVSLWMSTDGQSFSLIGEPGAVYSFDWTVPNADIEQTVSLRAAAVSSTGDTLIKFSDHDFVIAGQTMSHSLPAGWSLMSIPTDPSTASFDDSFNDDLGDAYALAYEYVNFGYQFPENFTKGRGYWLGLTQPVTADISGSPYTANQTAALERGWNIIGSPLASNILADSLIFFKDAVGKTMNEAKASGWINRLYGYDPVSGYSDADHLNPWGGYWLSVLENGVTVEYPIHKRPASAELRKSCITSPLLAFHAQSGEMRNDLLLIGQQPHATQGFDPLYDAVHPPVLPNGQKLELFVRHPESDLILGNKFVRDFRSENLNGEFEEWVIRCGCSNESVQLTWDLGHIPEGLQLGIDTNNDGNFEDMTQLTSLTLTDGDILPVRLGVNIVGTHERDIPDEFELMANYPNPFNPVTRIDYALSGSCRIDLSIYDIKGRHITTLISGDKPAGYGHVVWNGHNDSGNRVGSGMYIYRLQAGDFVQTRKMVLMK